MTDAAFDTLAAARNLEAAGVTRAHAEAIADTMRQAAGAGHEELATKADIDRLEAATKADIANLRADVYRALWMQAGAIVAAVVALVKLLP